ncbi:MAG: WD40 repeat domain-containing protein [Isosphaeraceae bacterium]
MATAGGDGTGRVWTMVPGVASPTLRRTFRVPVGDVNSAMFSPDATRLVTAGDDMHVRLWEVDTGRLLATFVHHGDAVVAASFTPDGRDIIAVYRNGALTRWDAATSQLRGEVASPALRIEGMTLDREGRTLFLMGSDVLRTVSLAPDGSFGPFTHAVVSEGGQCVALSPDSKRLAVAVRGNVSARIVDRAQPARTLDLVGPYAEGFGVAFSPDGKTLAAVDKTGTLRTWDASTGAGLLATCVHRGRVWAVAYAPDGRLVTGGDDGTVRLFDPSQPVGRIVVRGLRDAPGATAAEMVLSDDGRRLLACDSRGAVLEVDLPLVPGAGTPAHREFAPPASELISTAASLSPGGRYLLLRGRHTDPKRGHEIELYERRPGQPLARTLVIPRSPAESQLAWSTDGRHLAVNDETRCLVLWDIPGGRSLAKGPAVSEFYLEGVTFTASGDGVVVVGVDRTVKPWRHAVVRWDHRHGRSSRTLTTGLAAHDVWDETRSLALAPDGETLVALGAFRAFPVAIDLGTNTVAGEFIGAAAATADLAISPDGQRLATAHADGEVRLWDLHGRQLLLTLRGHARPARGVAFTPDGRWLLSLAEGPDVGIEVALWPVGP